MSPNGIHSLGRGPLRHS